MKTAREIYEEMLQSVQTRTGLPMDDSSDLAVRLYAASAQLESLYAYADWSRRQCFPHTAVGEYLDRHAQLQGLSRIPAAAATGSLRLQLASVKDTDHTIPSGTAFCTRDGLRFCLTEDCVIPAGSLSNFADARCETPGALGNVAYGAVCYFTQAPAYVTYVINLSPFSGGRDAESDEALRQRVLAACRQMPLSTNRDYYVSVACKQPNITSAATSVSEGAVTLYVSADYGLPTASQRAGVASALADRTELGVSLTVSSPTLSPVSLSVSVWPVDGVTGQEAVQSAKAALEALLACPMLEQGFYLSRAGSAIYATGKVKNYQFASNAEDLAPAPGTLYTKGTITVTEGQT